MYKIAFFGCQHLGYQSRQMNRRHPTGINLREHDGFVAHEATMRDILAHNVDGIVDGGDLFHVEHPSVRAVNTALRVDDLRVDASDVQGNPVWRITNGGNHDNGASTRLAAVSHIHRAFLDSRAVFPSTTRDAAENVGPWPGFYEVHQPNPEVPLYLHVVSHNGLDPALVKQGITIDPTPLDGGVNLLVSHGIFSADGRLFGADDRHGATRVIPEDWANRGWDQIILSDYHTMGPIPGFGPEDGRERGQVWMTGSALRRGFSDEESPRGWLEVTLNDNGTVTVTPHALWQRPQVDFPAIDARTMTTDEIDHTIRRRLAEQDLWDDHSHDVSGDGGFIVRQVISHTTPQQRRALAHHRQEWTAMATDAASWSADYTHPLTVDTTTPHSSDSPQITEHMPTSRNLVGEFTARRDTGRVGAVMKALQSDDPEVGKAVVEKVTATLEGVNTGS